MTGKGIRPAVLAIVIFAVFAPAADFAGAEVWHVRPDGGNPRQCNGLADRAYPGKGTGQTCAWQHPFIALPPGGEPRISGGDTLVIGQGQYRMGFGAPDTGNCHAAYSWDCHMPSLPSGPDAGNPTRVVGAGHDSGCADPPVLWGTERAAMIVNLQQTRHAEIACLDITDRSGCIELHCHAGNCAGEVLACKREQPPFGNWASNGIFAADAHDVELRDIRIHGLAGRGIQAGRISDWRLERVRILANGWAGWDGDIGEESSNHGRLEFEDVEIAWNGCAESWPELEIGGCWAQGAGGYGDGLGTAETGGEWVFERARIHHNTSDGLDLLYLDQSLDDKASVVINASLFEGNAGNQIKVDTSALISNSLVIGNCTYFSAQRNFADWDHCRAAGDAIFLGLGRRVESQLINNSITGEGNCLVSSAGDAGGRLVFANNLFVGQPAHTRDRPSCHFYSGQQNVDIAWRSNLVVGTHRGVCTSGNLCPPSAGIRSADVDDFDPTPLADSPLIGAASGKDRLPDDFRGLPRPAKGPHDIGAIDSTGTDAVDQDSRFRLRRNAPGTDSGSTDDRLHRQPRRGH